MPPQKGDMLVLTFFLWMTKPPPLTAGIFFSLPHLALLYFYNAPLTLLLPCDDVSQGKNTQLLLETKGRNTISLQRALHFMQPFDDHCALNTDLMLGSPQQPTSQNLLSSQTGHNSFGCEQFQLFFPKPLVVCAILGRRGFFATIQPTCILLWGLS